MNVFNQPENHPEAVVAYGKYLNNDHAPYSEFIEDRILDELTLIGAEHDRLEAFFNGANA